jgi:hypothetical protein
MYRRIGVGGALVLAVTVVVLAVTPLGGAAVGRVSALIAPTSKSAVVDVNAYENWGLNGCGSDCSRDGFKQVTHFDTGIYCLSGRTNPDNSMLKLTADAQHSNVVPIALMWDRSSPNCGAGLYEVYTYCFGEIIIEPGPVSPVLRAPENAPLCDGVAFYAEAFKR